MASGEMDDATFTDFLTNSLRASTTSLVNGGLAYVFMDWRHAEHLLAAARELSLEQVNLCIWNKLRGGQGSFYRSQHELVFVFKSGTAPHFNRVQLGKYGRDRTNVWNYEDSIGAARKGAEGHCQSKFPRQ